MKSLPFTLGRRLLGVDSASSLPPIEREAIGKLGAEKRQAEWIAGRLAARDALTALLGTLPRTLTIERAEDGAPELRGLPEPIPAISISHGHNEAIAVAGFVPSIGVDLCDIIDAPRVERVSERYLHAEEHALAVAQNDPRAFVTLWALKEAAAKALRLGLLDGGLRKTTLASLKPPRFSDPPLELHIINEPDQIIVVAWSLHS